MKKRNVLFNDALNFISSIIITDEGVEVVLLLGKIKKNSVKET